MELSSNSFHVESYLTQLYIVVNAIKWKNIFVFIFKENFMQHDSGDRYDICNLPLIVIRGSLHNKIKNEHELLLKD